MYDKLLQAVAATTFFKFAIAWHASALGRLLKYSD